MNLKYNKITIKIGSNVLTKKDGTLNVAQIVHLVDQIALLRKQGVEVILVSSGAVAAGRAVLHTLEKNDAVTSRQIWAALGQVKLINMYTDSFIKHGMLCAQVLTTKENFSSRRHYLNMKNCIISLLENKVIPVINENDTISVNELMFTDNDELSGLIATMVGSEALIILSNVDGIYDGNPEDKNSKLITQITKNEFDPEKSITTSKSGFGRGGMVTKFRIAKKVSNGGIGVHIARGDRENILVDILDRDKKVEHTYFVPEEKNTSAVKSWISYSDSFAKAHLVINYGASKALFSNKAVSLLPVGVVHVEGTFHKGDLLKIFNEQNKLLGLGKAQYHSEKLLEEMAGQKKGLDGDKQKPVIHYDYLYLEEINIGSE